jgi:hypothetical protein
MLELRANDPYFCCKCFQINNAKLGPCFELASQSKVIHEYDAKDIAPALKLSVSRGWSGRYTGKKGRDIKFQYTPRI